MLNYGHTSISCKPHARSLVSACFRARFWRRDERCTWCASLRHDVKQCFRVPLPPTSDGRSRVERAGSVYNYIRIRIKMKYIAGTFLGYCRNGNMRVAPYPMVFNYSPPLGIIKGFFFFLHHNSPYTVWTMPVIVILSRQYLTYGIQS